MRVMMVPDYDGNQYQQLLTDALNDTGVETVSGPPAIPFSPILLWLLVQRVDVLHLHWLHPFFLFGSYRRLYTIPGSRLLCGLAAIVFLIQVRLASYLCDQVVWTAHNKRNHERRYESLDQWVTRKIAMSVNGVQVWDSHTRAELLEYLEGDVSPITEIPHGNYFPLYDDTSQPGKMDARRELDIASFNTVYLYFGVIRPYKQVPKLIETFQMMDTDDTCLLIAGSPKYDELATHIRKLANDDPTVRLQLSYIPDEAVPTYFAACDAAVFPYKDIFNSGSVMLAMSLGRLFVAPHTGSIQSVAPDGNVLYDELANGLQTVQAIPRAKLETTGERNRKVAKRAYDWNDIAEQIVKFYGVQ